MTYGAANGSLVLYRLGPDFHDDGGASARGQDGRPRVRAEKGDTVLWPVNP